MPLSIGVLGATGVYARHLIPRLVARGHRIRALVRRPEAAAIATACGADVSRVVQQSIAMVNAAGGDAWSDEDTAYAAPLDDVVGLAVSAALAMEQAVRSADRDWLVLRGGLFYGPGTGFDDDWFARAH